MKRKSPKTKTAFKPIIDNIVVEKNNLCLALVAFDERYKSLDELLAEVNANGNTGANPLMEDVLVFSDVANNLRRIADRIESLVYFYKSNETSKW